VSTHRLAGERADVVVVGAGIVGAACAYQLCRRGLRVTVVDAGAIGGGTTGAGEGNVLVSDKPAGAELALALRSRALWEEYAADTAVRDAVEFDAKGGLVVAADAAQFAALRATAAAQREAGVAALEVPGSELATLEPRLRPGLAGGVHYPQDAQVQPVLATARLLRDARATGAVLRTGVRVAGFLRAGDRVVGVRTDAGDVPAGAVVNAAGVAAGELAALAGASLPVAPRRGFVLVTEPLPRVVRHKVYAADYVTKVASGTAGLEVSPVVEGTRAGTVLIGSSRERVGLSRRYDLTAPRRIAARAIALFPFLAEVRALRVYHGFRPYLPDHLPAVGPDPRAPGLWHACGHEGAGIGLSMATGELVAALLSGERPAVDPRPFAPDRFAREAA
jgi:glycine/D-amino acid oxidase-like deaminating enzyme